MGFGPLLRNAASTRVEGAADPRDAASGPLMPNERDRMRLEYVRAGKDKRVLRLLDELEQREAALARALARVQEAESRLTRRVRHEP